MSAEGKMGGFFVVILEDWLGLRARHELDSNRRRLRLDQVSNIRCDVVLYVGQGLGQTTNAWRGKVWPKEWACRSTDGKDQQQRQRKKSRPCHGEELLERLCSVQDACDL